MKKRYGIGIVVAILTFFGGCGIKTEKDSEENARLILSETEITLSVGESYYLTAALIPRDGSATVFYWKATDEEIVSVEGGRVFAKSVGETVVFVQTGENTAHCKVKVTN